MSSPSLRVSVPLEETKAAEGDIVVDVGGAPTPDVISAAKAAGQSARVQSLAGLPTYKDQAFILCDQNLTDTPIIYASPAFCSMTGYATEDLIGHNCRLLQGPATDPLTSVRIGEAVRSGEEASFTVLNYRKDGTMWWNHLFLAPINLPSADESVPTSPTIGPKPLYIGIQLDVTLARSLLNSSQADGVSSSLPSTTDPTPSSTSSPSTQPSSAVIGGAAAGGGGGGGAAAAASGTDVTKSVSRRLPAADMSWSNIKYTVTDGATGEDKLVLKSISGVCQAGQLMAVMGPSGGGKTTLLNCLAKRQSIDSGSILINGQPIRREDKRRMGYVCQDDVLLSNLTVRETFNYIAALRLGGDAESRQQRVQEVIDELQLNKCADTKIGDAFSRGVSGGERKRASIGVELLTNPPLMLLDEPTSGLDSSIALSLVSTLKRLAQAGRTVICSIHQPSSQVFSQFDNLLLLGEGHPLFMGPAHTVHRYLAAPPLSLVCPGQWNIADYLLEVSNDPATLPRLVDQWKKEMEEADAAAATTTTTTKADGSDDGQGVINVVVDGEGGAGQPETPETPMVSADLPDATRRAVQRHLKLVQAQSTRQFMSWRQPQSQSALLTDAAGAGEGGDGSTASSGGGGAGGGDSSALAASKPPAKARRWPTTFFQQLQILTSRTLKQNAPAKLGNLTAGQTLAMTLVVSLLWFQIDDTATTINDREAVLFFTSVYWMFNPLFQALTSLPAEQAVLRRERASGFFRLSAWFLSKSMADLPLTLLFPFLMGTVVYWCAGLRPDAGAYISFILILLLNVLVAESYGLLIAAAVMNFQRSLVIAATTTLLQMLAAGFYVESIPPFVSWVSYFSMIRYTYPSLVAIEFYDDRELPCEPGEPVDFPNCPVLGKQVQDRLDGLPVLANVGCLFLLAIMFRLGAYAFLRHRTAIKSN